MNNSVKCTTSSSEELSIYSSNTTRFRSHFKKNAGTSDRQTRNHGAHHGAHAQVQEQPAARAETVRRRRAPPGRRQRFQVRHLRQARRHVQGRTGNLRIRDNDEVVQRGFVGTRVVRGDTLLEERRRETTSDVCVCVNVGE